MSFEKKPKAHDQFAKIDRPYMKAWEARQDGKELLQSARLVDRALGEVVEKIRKPLKARTRKKRNVGAGRRHDTEQEEE